MIQLTIETSPFPIPNTTCTLEFTRLKSLVGFRKVASTEYLLAEGIIDTGAYVTVLPNSFAAELELEVVGSYSLSGINRRAECAIPVVVAYGFCLLFDEQGHQSPELRVPCYVSQTDEVPVILGIAGLLSEFEFCFDHHKRVAYLTEVLQKRFVTPQKAQNDHRDTETSRREKLCVSVWFLWPLWCDRAFCKSPDLK